MWLRHQWRLLEEAGGEGGEGGGGGGGEGGEKGPDLAAVTAQLGTVTQALGMLAQGQAAVQAQVQALVDAGNKPPPKVEERHDENAPLFEGLDLEQMDRSQFGTVLVAKMIDRLGSVIDAKLKPVTEKIAGVESSFTKDLGARTISDVAKDNKDLYEWKTEIGTILKDSPSLSLGRALAIARSEDPTKAAAMAKKYASGGDGEKRAPFLALTPTSRQGADDGKKGRMKFNEAAERAFDDAVAALGASDFSQLTSGASRRG